VRNLGKECCSILFLELVGDFTEAIVADEEHIFLRDACAEGRCFHELYVEVGIYLPEVVFLEARWLGEVDNRIGADGKRILLCKVMKSKTQTSVASTHFYNVYLGKPEALEMTKNKVAMKDVSEIGGGGHNVCIVGGHG